MAFSLLVVGASLGGLQALQSIFGGLPAELHLPLAVVQHRSAQTSCELARVLRRYSPLPVREAEDKEEIVPGTVFLAPADYHLLLDGGRFALSTEAPVWHARPSIDLLFESAADSLGSRVAGLILTGTSRDGARGLARIKESGGLALVQDPDTARGRTMPEAAIAGTRVDRILPLSAIPSFLIGLDAQREGRA